MRASGMLVACMAGALVCAPAAAGELAVLEQARAPKPASAGACVRLDDQALAPLPLEVPVIVHFWASWCAPCRKELPELVRFVHRYGLRLDLVSVDRNAKAARALLGRLGVREDRLVRLLWDATGNAHRQWAVRALPTSYFVGPEGRLVARAIGTRRWQDAGFARRVLAAMRRTPQGEGR